MCLYISGEGNGTPLQYSCLENPMDGDFPMDGEAWWAAVHGVTKSRTRLSNFTFFLSFHALSCNYGFWFWILDWDPHIDFSSWHRFFLPRALGGSISLSWKYLSYLFLLFVLLAAFSAALFTLNSIRKIKENIFSIWKNIVEKFWKCYWI